ncbi:MAG: alpha-amylase family glycosyl hydrolase, partial [Syntrophothermus sp.]
MKILKILAFLIMISGSGYAQTIVTIPVYPVDDDSCTVIFDATRGNGELANVPPPVYAHTGVITNLSSSPSDWKHVIAGWGENTPKALMTPLGNNKYQLKIFPSIRTFYNVPAGETILKLAFVFRNADGSKVGREAGGGDIFADVYPSALSVNIVLPKDHRLFLYPAGNIFIPIRAISPLADSMFIYLNDNLGKKVSGQIITDTVLASNFGHNWTDQVIRIIGKNNSGAASDSVIYQIITNPVIENVPPGIKDGINYIDSTSAILCLYAPYKDNCFVSGDFNNWQLDSLHYMKVSPDLKRYWIKLENLVPRQEYIFQYFVNGVLAIADPYTEKVSDPNDQYIPASTYPGLLPYPDGKAIGIASVLQTGQSPYSWDTASFTPPATRDLVIYELLLRDFLAKHDYQTLEDTLSYFRRLGVNAIELMPIMEFEGNESWGYNPDFLFAPDKYYGPANSLKHFIEAAHSKGIAVILDIVVNHQFGSSPLVRLYWDEALNRPLPISPYFNPIPKHPFNVGYDFNHASVTTRDYFSRVFKYWITEYHIDGYRFDMSKGLTQVNSYPDDVAKWGHYDAGRISFLKSYYDTIRTVKQNFILILEHFADNDEEQVLSSYGMLLWGNMNYAYCQSAMGYNDGSDFSWISYKTRGWNDPHVVGYMESHDEERTMFKTLTYGNSSGWYNTREMGLALKRQEMNAAFFYTVPGPKMLWEFGELGYDYSINSNGGRLAPKPPRWDYLDDWKRKYLYNTVSALIHLKKTEPVFSTGDFSINASSPAKTIHLNGPDMKVTIAGNFDVNAMYVDPAFQNTGTWYDYFSGDSLNVTDPNV